MVIHLTDEQYNQIIQGDCKGDVKYGWLHLKHEPSEFELYLETKTENDKTLITYVEANPSGPNKFYGDKETIQRFCDFGTRRKLTDDSNRCPNCYTPMIYHFNYCPKCGQILKWQEGEDDRKRNV